MSNMVKRVAEALEHAIERCEFDGEPCRVPIYEYENVARAAIAEMREPTQAMCTAGYLNARHSIEPVGELAPPPEEQPKLIFQAMIDEALKS